MLPEISFILSCPGYPEDQVIYLKHSAASSAEAAHIALHIPAEITAVHAASAAAHH